MEDKRALITFYELGSDELAPYDKMPNMQKSKLSRKKLIAAAVISVALAGSAIGAFFALRDKKDDSFLRAVNKIERREGLSESSFAATMPVTARPPEETAAITKSSSSLSAAENGSAESLDDVSSLTEESSGSSPGYITQEMRDTIYEYMFVNDILLSPAQNFFGKSREKIAELFGLTDELYEIQDIGDGQKEMLITILYGDDTSEEIGILFTEDDRVFAVGNSKDIAYDKEQLLNDITNIIGEPHLVYEEPDDVSGLSEMHYRWELGQYSYLLVITELDNGKIHCEQTIYSWAEQSL